MFRNILIKQSLLWLFPFYSSRPSNLASITDRVVHGLRDEDDMYNCNMDDEDFMEHTLLAKKITGIDGLSTRYLL